VEDLAGPCKHRGICPVHEGKGLVRGPMDSVSYAVHSAVLLASRA
jgi:hypothetical protein